LNAAHASELDWEKALANSPFKDDIPNWLRETHDLLFEAPAQRLSQS
jgi:hypothetical protein